MSYIALVSPADQKGTPCPNSIADAMHGNGEWRGNGMNPF